MKNMYQNLREDPDKIRFTMIEQGHETIYEFG